MFTPVWECIILEIPDDSVVEYFGIADMPNIFAASGFISAFCQRDPEGHHETYKSVHEIVDSR